MRLHAPLLYVPGATPPAGVSSSLLTNRLRRVLRVNTQRVANQEKLLLGWWSGIVGEENSDDSVGIHPSNILPFNVGCY